MIKLKETSKKINPKKEQPKQEDNFMGMKLEDIYHYQLESEIAYREYLKQKGELS